MQIKLIPAALLFIASYFPLALILAVQDIKEEYWQRPFCLDAKFWLKCELPEFGNPGLVYALVLVCFCSLVFFLWVLKHLNGSTEMIIEECKAVPNDLINYVFPYIVSFMGVELGSTGKVLGFGLFLLWLFLISYRSGQILMNPLLLAAGWQLYEVQADIEGKKRSLRALSRNRVVPGKTLKSCLVQGIYVLSETKNHD
ncbi:hypothetical protein GG851_23210 [Bordetella petrii]|nr:hypothetical protein [Bordetella petrii]